MEGNVGMEFEPWICLMGKRTAPMGVCGRDEVTTARRAGVNDEGLERGVNADNATMRV